MIQGLHDIHVFYLLNEKPKAYPIRSFFIPFLIHFNAEKLLEDFKEWSQSPDGEGKPESTAQQDMARLLKIHKAIGPDSPGRNDQHWFDQRFVVHLSIVEASQT